MTFKKIFKNPVRVCAYFLVLIGLYFAVAGIIAAKSVLAPVIIALILAMLSVPLARKLESWSFSRFWSTTSVLLINLIVILGVTAVLSFQVRNFLEDSDDLKKQFYPTLVSIESFVLKHTPLDRGKLESYKEEFGLEEDEKPEEKPGEEEVKENQKEAIEVLGATFSFFADFILMFVYLFLFLLYRKKFFKFSMLLFPKTERDRYKKTIVKSTDLVQHYLGGRLILMVFLVLLYSLGLWISGVENFILASLIGAVLSLIPFIGNMAAYVIALILGVGSGGDTNMVIMITVTFLLVQFLDTYVFQPIVFSNKLNINPFFVILSVLIGNAIWGIIGMVISIPLFAIITIFCRNIPELKAFGYLFSNEEKVLKSE
jgi:predicted PurR-regulated permease PerM